MKKLLFFNRIPIIDSFVSEMISGKVMDLTIVRTISALRQQARIKKFDILLLNVDDRLNEILYISEITRLRKLKVRTVVFGQYDDQFQKLKKAGVSTFLRDEPGTEDFELALG